jgi:predicted ChrR family anti-sigma factor
MREADILLHDTGAFKERLTLYALGMLDDGECAAVADHVGLCERCASEIRSLHEAASDLPYALPDVNPHPRVRERVLSIAANKRKLPIEQPLPGLFVSRESQQVWRKTPFAGVDAKILYVDPESKNITSLLRMQPGSKYPAHHHAGVEQCIMLEGSVRIGTITMERGDFGFAAAGSNHSVIETDGGCLMVLISNQDDEVFA